MSEIMSRTLQHLLLSFMAVGSAALIGIPAGLLITRYKKLAWGVLAFTEMVQTIPSLALLAILMMIFGLGDTTLILALFLYSLLPVVRNTYTGIMSVDKGVLEAANGMGMTSFQILGKIKLPLALPMILSGLRIALVTALGVATIGVLIGAGGLGGYIYRGVQMGGDLNLIAKGAIPVSLLAIGLDLGLQKMEKRMVRHKNLKRSEKG